MGHNGIVLDTSYLSQVRSGSNIQTQGPVIAQAMQFDNNSIPMAQATAFCNNDNNNYTTSNNEIPTANVTASDSKQSDTKSFSDSKISSSSSAAPIQMNKMMVEVPEGAVPGSTLTILAPDDVTHVVVSSTVKITITTSYHQ